MLHIPADIAEAADSRRVSLLVSYDSWLDSLFDHINNGT
jgi:hypothetical protein